MSPRGYFFVEMKNESLRRELLLLWSEPLRGYIVVEIKNEHHCRDSNCCECEDA
jgi:hypothetical protein